MNIEETSYGEIHMRHLDILPEDAWDKSITIVGVGGIGSTTTMMLAKMGAKNLKIIDFDSVSMHNISTQHYGLKDIGQPKVVALAERIKEDIGAEITPITARAESLPNADIVILALDSMDERIKLINASKEENDLPEWLIEARMGLEMIRVYTLNPVNEAQMSVYDKTLYPSAEAEALPCSGRAVAYNTYFIASVICSQVKKILNNEQAPLEIIGDIGKFGFFKMD